MRATGMKDALGFWPCDKAGERLTMDRPLQTPAHADEGALHRHATSEFVDFQGIEPGNSRGPASILGDSVRLAFQVGNELLRAAAATCQE